LHPVHQNSPIGKAFAHLASLALNQGIIIKDLKSKVDGKIKIQEDRLAAGPKNRVSASGSAGAKKLKIGSNGKVDPNEEIDFGSIVQELKGSDDE
jgi:hypothetical protein